MAGRGPQRGPAVITDFGGEGFGKSGHREIVKAPEIQRDAPQVPRFPDRLLSFCSRFSPTYLPGECLVHSQ